MEVLNRSLVKTTCFNLWFPSTKNQTKLSHIKYKPKNKLVSCATAIKHFDQNKSKPSVGIQIRNLNIPYLDRKRRIDYQDQKNCEFKGKIFYFVETVKEFLMQAIVPIFPSY